MKSRLIVGESSEVLSLFDNDCIDLVLTSPPYDDIRDYEGYSFDFNKIIKQLIRIVKPGGVVVWVVGDKIKNGRSLTSFRQAISFQDIGFFIHDIMIYQKMNTAFMRRNAYTNAYEFMFVMSKGKPRVFNPIMENTVRQGVGTTLYNRKSDGIRKSKKVVLNDVKVKTNIWPYAVGLGGSTSDKIAFDHPAIFPEKLARDHIFSWTNEGDVVLDPFSGSGTTCKMAKSMGRVYIGIDISQKYTDIAEKRLLMVDAIQPSLF